MSLEAQQVETLSLLSKVSSKLTDRVLDLEKAVGNTIGMAVKTANNKPEKSEAVSNVLGMQANLGEKEPEAIVKEADPVIIADIGKDAKKDFKEVLMPSEAQQEININEEGGIMSHLKQLIGPALIILGSLGALVGGLFAEGGSGMQDALQVIGKGGLALGLKLAAKTAGTLLKPVLNKLPLIGSLISFGFAYSAFKNDDFVGGLFDLASGLTGLLYFVPGGQPFVFPLQMGIDTLSAMLSLGTTQEEGETLGQAKLRTLKEFMGPIFGIIKKVQPMRMFFAIGEGIQEIFKGNIVSGLSKIATANPIFDIINLFNNVFLGGEGSVDDMAAGLADKTRGVIGGAKEFVSALIEPIKDKFPMKNFIGIYEGIGKVFSGNFKEGLIQIGENGLPGLKAIGNFFFGSTDAETGEKKDAGYKKVLGSIGSVFSSIKNKVLLKLLDLFPEQFGIRNRVANLLGIDLGSVEDECGNRSSGTNEARDQNTKEIYGEYAGMSAAEQIAAGRKFEEKREGGPVRKNKPYMVGEAGPELFVPTDNGNIVDNTSTLNLENILDKNTFIDVTNMNMKIGNLQFAELKKNNMLLQAILEKSNSGNTIINNRSNSIVNNQSRSGFRDMQFAV
jgi:hypothetical protein